MTGGGPKREDDLSISNSLVLFATSLEAFIEAFFDTLAGK